MKTEKKIKTSKLLLIVIIVFLLSLVAGFISVYFTTPDLKEVIDNSIIEIIPGETPDDVIDDEEIPDVVYPDEEEKVFIALNLDNGTEIVMYELDLGSIFNQPTTPIKQGWVFDAWSSTVAYAWGTPVIENMTITALYTKLYDVALNYNEEFWEDETRTERIEEYSIIRNDVLLLPTLPTTEEYFVFDGWLEEGTTNVFVNQAQIQRDMVLIAQFRDIRPAVVEPILNYDAETKTISILNASAFTSVLLTVSSPDESVCFSGNSDSYTFSSSLGSGNYIANATATDEWGRETTNSINIDYTVSIPDIEEPELLDVLISETDAGEFEISFTLQNSYCFLDIFNSNQELVYTTGVLTTGNTTSYFYENKNIYQIISSQSEFIVTNGIYYVRVFTGAHNYKSDFIEFEVKNFNTIPDNAISSLRYYQYENKAYFETSFLPALQGISFAISIKIPVGEYVLQENGVVKVNTSNKITIIDSNSFALSLTSGNYVAEISIYGQANYDQFYQIKTFNIEFSI